MTSYNEEYFEAAQDLYAYYQYLTDTLEKDDDENMADGMAYDMPDNKDVTFSIWKIQKL